MTFEFVGSPGVQTDIANGDMILTWYDHRSDDHRPAVVIRVPASQIESLMRDVTNIGLQLLMHALVSVNAGDCRTCNNVGMVDEERYGRPWRVHCPDCGPRKVADAVLRDMPRVVPSGFREEVTHVGIGSVLVEADDEPDPGPEDRGLPR